MPPPAGALYAHGQGTVRRSRGPGRGGRRVPAARGRRSRARLRVARLEQELARARSDAQTQELERLNQQVAALREQLAQEQARRQAEELAAQEARAREQEATSALAAAQQQLATGDYHALDTLESVSGSLPAPVQSAVQSARAAIQNGDLGTARYWLSIALAEEQRRLLTH